LETKTRIIEELNHTRKGKIIIEINFFKKKN